MILIAESIPFALLSPPLFDWRRAMIESDLTATTKHVLWTLSAHMSVAGDSCFPSLVRLAKEASLNKATVCDHLRLAEKLGWIVREAGGGRLSTRYRAATPPSPTRGAVVQDDSSGPGGGQELSSRTTRGSHRERHRERQETTAAERPSSNGKKERPETPIGIVLEHLIQVGYHGERPPEDILRRDGSVARQMLAAGKTPEEIVTAIDGVPYLSGKWATDDFSLRLVRAVFDHAYHAGWKKAPPPRGVMAELTQILTQEGLL